VYQKLSKLVHACQNYSFPKLARFFETQCRMVWLPDGWLDGWMVKKILMICLFVLTQLTNVTDTLTHTETDRHGMTA